MRRRMSDGLDELTEAILSGHNGAALDFPGQECEFLNFADAVGQEARDAGIGGQDFAIGQCQGTPPIFLSATTSASPNTICRGVIFFIVIVFFFLFFFGWIGNFGNDCLAKAIRIAGDKDGIVIGNKVPRLENILGTRIGCFVRRRRRRLVGARMMCFVSL